MNDVLEQTLSVAAVEKLANKLLMNEWEIDTLPFNLKKLGWNFEFNNSKKALGLCVFDNKTIYISKFFFVTNNNFELWNDTIRHEIAHAIDFEIRNTSNHDAFWKRIAKMVGSVPNKNYLGPKLKIVGNKYTLKCSVCEKEVPKHRKPAKPKACQKCCNDHNKGNYTDKYLLTLIKNF